MTKKELDVSNYPISKGKSALILNYQSWFV